MPGAIGACSQTCTGGELANREAQSIKDAADSVSGIAAYMQRALIALGSELQALQRAINENPPGPGFRGLIAPLAAQSAVIITTERAQAGQLLADAADNAASHARQARGVIDDLKNSLDEGTTGLGACTPLLGAAAARADAAMMNVETSIAAFRLYLDARRRYADNLASEVREIYALGEATDAQATVGVMARMNSFMTLGTRALSDMAATARQSNDALYEAFPELFAAYRALWAFPGIPDQLKQDLQSRMDELQAHGLATRNPPAQAQRPPGPTP